MFQIAIVQNGAQWGAAILSVEDQKSQTITANTLSNLLTRIRSSVVKKEQEARNFPIPEPNRIITLEHSANGS